MEAKRWCKSLMYTTLQFFYALSRRVTEQYSLREVGLLYVQPMLIYQHSFSNSLSPLSHFKFPLKVLRFVSSKTETSDCIRYSAAPKIKLFYRVTNYSMYNLTRGCMNYRETVCSTRPPSRGPLVSAAIHRANFILAERT